MHALHLRRMHEDLAERPRRRHEGERIRLDLERDRGRLFAASPAKKSVRCVAAITCRKARRMVSSSRLATVFERGFDLAWPYGSRRARAARHRARSAPRRARREARRYPDSGEARPRDSRSNRGSRSAAGSARSCAAARRAPVETGGEHQRIEAVVLRLVAPDGEHGVVQTRPPRRGRRLAVAPNQRHIVAVERRAGLARDAVGALVHDREAEILEQRHAPRQRDRVAEMVEGHHRPRLRHVGPAEEADLDVLRREALGDLHVVQRMLGGEASRGSRSRRRPHSREEAR